MDVQRWGGREREEAGKPRVRIAQRVVPRLRQAWSPAYGLASTNRQVATALVYGVVAVAAYCTAFLLRFDFRIPPDQVGALARTLPIVLLLRLATSYGFGISTGRWRYVSTGDVLRLVTSALTASAIVFGLTWGTGVLPIVPRSVLIVDLFLFTWITAAVWILYRLGFERIRALGGERHPLTRVLIVGAGEAGTMLAREMMRASLRQQAVGFVDDDPAKLNAQVHGLRVLGCIAELRELVAKHRVQEIVIAVPSASPGQLRRIVECCEATDLVFKVLPGLSAVLEGGVRWSQVRALRIEDLLGRAPIALELPELHGDLHGQAVLITGAAGSIGSELARQVALHRPALLVLLDLWETGLFNLARDLREQHSDMPMRFVIADVTDDVAVDDVFQRFAPTRVFHAAAYKHVTMMQSNVRPAIRNNVLGTMLVGVAAGRHQAEKFVFVSTDKAVTPTSVMGATKRLGELLVMELQARYPATTYAAVRFGNVLGSSGSVIPIFREQIEKGRPLTVTHPDATRYFMMITEAVQLILHASLLPEVRGQIAMLDMGEPVRIVDLARNLLRIAGLPHRNGKSVVFTGLREGEKLHEQLLAPGEHSVPTRIDKVRIVRSGPALHTSVIRLLAEWELAFREDRLEDVLDGLVGLFPGLIATGGVRDDVLQQAH